MTAEEMFLELGFKLKYNTTGTMRYQKETIYNYRDMEIEFLKEYKEYHIENIDIITKDLHKAITKQIQELGWNE